MPDFPWSRRRWLQFSSAASVAALCGGCEQKREKAAESKAAPPVTLRVLVVDDVPLGEAIQKEWHARTEKEVAVEQVSFATVSEASRLPGDVIVFPSLLMGQLVERSLIRPLGETLLTSEAVSSQDIFPLTRREEITWGEATYALPLSAPQLVLTYRPDIFERIEMKPPATWEEYQAAAAKLADRSLVGDVAPADQPWRGTAEPTGAGFGGPLLLARAAAYASHLEQRTPLFGMPGCEPLIDRPPFVRALAELAACSAASAPLATPADAMTELLSGRCAMALAWPASQPLAAGMTAPAVRFAELPGSPDVFDFRAAAWDRRRNDEDERVPFVGIAGRLAAVTSGTPHVSPAEGMVGWLSGAEVSSRIGPVSFGAGPFRTSHRQFLSQWVGSLPAEAAGQYFEVVQASLSRSRAMTTVRLPGSDRYLAALDDAVRRTTVDGADPQESLRQAAQEWRKITTDVGTQNQSAALARSIGAID